MTSSRAKWWNLASWNSTHLSCISMLRLWRKLPPKAKQSTGVSTAWIQPGEYTGGVGVEGEPVVPVGRLRV